MSSLKMKVKKIFFLIIALLSPYYLPAHLIYHTMTSVTEQTMLGHTFKHVMVSGSAQKDEFFINGQAVSKENYYKEFDRIQKKEWDEHALQQEQLRRSRIDFSQTVQVEVAAKLLNTIVVQIIDLLKKCSNPSLAKFFVYTDKTIESADQFQQLDAFMNQLNSSLQKIIENKDIESLQHLHKNLEPWPVRLEKFFQDTVQQAIAKSDDTAVLKELLTLTCDQF
ncbi:hypothetical protein [Candidatus Chromulinivorax destructor]|nr:hypothetical protein [Candidatus Chromulinivorax destructor]